MTICSCVPLVGETIIFGVQHVVAMTGGTIIVPLIMGFDPSLALFFSGLGTLIFFVVVAGRLPSYLGSSGAFVAVVVAAIGFDGHGSNPHFGWPWAALSPPVCFTG